MLSHFGEITIVMEEGFSLGCGLLLNRYALDWSGYIPNLFVCEAVVEYTGLVLHDIL